MKHPHRARTIKELAKKAGVSVATISRALNPETRDRVAPNTREAIDRLALQHAYTPHLSAKYLRRRTTKTLGIIIPYERGVFDNVYYTQLLTGLSDALRDTDYQFKLLLLKGEQRQWQRHDFRAGEQVDGVITTHWYRFFSHHAVSDMINVPCVIINDYESRLQARFVCGDHAAGGQMAAQHFYERGHRHLAVIAGPSWSRDNKQRVEGFTKFLSQVGIVLPSECIVRADYSEPEAFEVAGALLRRDRAITAIFCCNDQMAFGVLRRLQAMGISCPENVSVIGYDDEPRAALCQPPLTTIRAPLYHMAQEAARLLLEYLATPARNAVSFVGSTVLPVTLVERASVKRLAG